MSINTAVKRCACVRGSLLAGCDPLSRPKFQRKTYKVTALSLNERTKIKTHLDICRRKEKSKEKESLRLMEHKVFSSTGFLSIYHFVLSFNRKVKCFLKHRVLLACVVVVTLVRQLCSDGLKARHLVITTFAHAETLTAVLTQIL